MGVKNVFGCNILLISVASFYQFRPGVKTLSCKHTKRQAERQASRIHCAYVMLHLMLRNGSGVDFQVSQCTMDLDTWVDAAADAPLDARCGYTLK